MLDDVDLALIHALSLDGRASFTKIAEVLGVSAQTVQRRYSKLHANVGLRVVAAIDPATHGDQQWLLRISASASGAQGVARALTRRPDTSWVRLASGGTEIIAVVTTTAAEREARVPQQLLLRDIPKTASITGVAAHQLIHTYRGGPTPWSGRLAALSPEQQAAFLPSPDTSDRRNRRTLDADDRRLLDALTIDARFTLRALTARTGLPETSIARRITTLLAEGIVYFDLDLDDTAAFSVTDKTFLWVSVPPHDLDHAAAKLAEHSQLAFVAAITGPSNLVALALTGQPDGLYQYIARDLSQIASITRLETAPVLRTLKTVQQPTDRNKT